MRVYRIDYTDDSGCNRVAWASVKADAKTKQWALIRDFGRGNVDEYRPYSIPDDREAFIMFLNSQCTRG